MRVGALRPGLSAELTLSWLWDTGVVLAGRPWRTGLRVMDVSRGSVGRRCGSIGLVWRWWMMKRRV